jgi:AraC family transcriptional activator of pobA
MEKALMNEQSDFKKELKLAGFKAYGIESKDIVMREYTRKDFYKICLTNGKNDIHYSDRTFKTEGSILFFGNPHIPYSWEVLSTTYTGYTCLFSEAFMKGGERSDILQNSPLFQLGGTPIFVLDEEQRVNVSAIFEKIIAEQASEYIYKDDLIRSYLHLLIHEALKLKPTDSLQDGAGALGRLTSVFFDLLERQFPIESAEQPLRLKTAQDYAGGLHVHVNYLNRAVKTITGKSTTTHIADRIIIEARALLQHTNWPVAEIAYALGFDYVTYFNNFFKKHTGDNPTSLRTKLV